MKFGSRSTWVQAMAMTCAALLIPGDIPLWAQQQQTPSQAPPAAGAEAPKLKSPDQLDSLVAPIALYPDPLLGQILAASTYPLEIVQAARWMKENGSKLKGEALTKAAQKQPWDPSIQAMVAFPDVITLLDKNITWTQDLGNAFLDQQSDVMDAVQRMRKKAKDAGKLESSKEQKIEVKTVEQKTVIEIQPSDPQVIYVPQYNPVVVYGAAPVYAYPPVTYPWYGYAATAALSFGVGVAMGAFWSGGGGWGWGCGWSNNNITINNNFNTRNNYNQVNGGNRNNVANGNRGGNSSWKHNPDHRRSVPYNNRDTAQKFGGTARDRNGNTQRFDNRGNQGLGDRGNNNRGNQGIGDRGNQGVADRGNNRGNQGVGDRNSGARNSGGDKIGNRSIDSSSRSNSAFGDSGSRARSEASSNRGASSQRSSGGGGFSGGGARSGGASRGGGGRRR